jgi:hypothetical protein
VNVGEDENCEDIEAEKSDKNGKERLVNLSKG